MWRWTTPSGLTPDLRRGAALSATLHVLVVAAILIGLPLPRPPEAPPATAVDMVFQGPAQSTMKAPAPGKVPAPANTATKLPQPPAFQPPKPNPNEFAPPPPPPPPPPPQTETVKPPVPTPTPPTPAPPPEPAPTPTPALPVPPTPTPPPPKPTPPKPQPRLPVPPLPVPPPPLPSQTSQPNPTKNPAPQTHALENTLLKLRAELKQQPPKARYNPAQGGAPNGGGSPTGNDTASLTAAERNAIGAYVRRCWTYDPGAPDVNQMHVMMTVTTDADGVARIVAFDPADQGRMASDPVFQAFAERARRAVLDPRCANLPLPNIMLGKVNVLSFRFSP